VPSTVQAAAIKACTSKEICLEAFTKAKWSKITIPFSTHELLALHAPLRPNTVSFWLQRWSKLIMSKLDQIFTIPTTLSSMSVNTGLGVTTLYDLENVFEMVNTWCRENSAMDPTLRSGLQEIECMSSLPFLLLARYALELREEHRSKGEPDRCL